MSGLTLAATRGWAPEWWRSGRRSWVWWAASLVVYGFLAYDASIWGPASATTVESNFLADATGIAEVTVGLLFWMWRPRNPVGPLLVFYPLFFVLQDLGWALFPGSRVAATFQMTIAYVYAALYTAVLLMFPSGRLPNRWAGALIAWIAVLAVVGNLPVQLFGGFYLFPVPHSYLYLGHGWSGSYEYNTSFMWLGVATWLIVVGFLLWRMWTTVPGARMRVVPLLLVGVFAFAFNSSTAVFLSQARLPPEWSYGPQNIYAALSAAAAAYGLAAVRRKRGAVADLVVELEHAEPGQVRESLAAALGDPALQLGLWLHHRQAWVGEDGDEVSIPRDGSRGVTYVGERLAVLVHDRDLLDQPRLLQAAGSAARLSLENGRLQAQLRAQVAEVRESRARVVQSVDRERRRLERDLREGAQRRLLGLREDLAGLDGHLDPGGRSLLGEADDELGQALVELGELARGIHPAVLTEDGLGAAVRSLAERAPFPVEVTDCRERLPEPIETAAYFVVSEALANVAKYARASRAWVSVHRENGHALVEVRDDGVGGADPRGGSGLRGLADRVGALDGRLTVRSPAGGGTLVAAEIPCPA